MPFLPRFRQNAFQLSLLVWGTLLHIVIGLWAVSNFVAQTQGHYHYFLIASIACTLSFWGSHWIFSWIFQSIPWRKLRWTVLFVELLFILIPLLVEIPLLFYYNRNYDFFMGLSLLATNTQEAWEFLNSLGLLPLVMLILGLLSLLGISYFGVRTLQHHAKIWHKLSWTTRPSWMLVLICGLVWAGLTSFHARRMLVGGQVLDLHLSTSTDRLVWCTMMVAKDRKDHAKHLQEMKSPQHFVGFSHHPITQEPLKVVIILGESARADLMSAYGYERTTTPWLDSMNKNGNEVVVFNDVCSSASNTIMASQRIFTFWNNVPNRQWYNFPDLTNIFAHAGYFTQWFTNQGTVDPYSVERLLASSAQKLHITSKKMGTFTRNDGSSVLTTYDGLLLSPIKRDDSNVLYDKKDKGSLTVIHLMGSHYTYANRYPSAFDYFKPNEMTECLTDDAKRQKAAYLNSLRYTDYLLEKMIAHYKNQRALVFYFSDHGEMVDEPQQRGFFGHGGNVEHPSVDVPFFVYASPQLRKEHPELWTRIKKAQFRPISTAWFTNSLTSLLGIHTKYNDERYNFFSDSFANPQRIAVQGDTRHVIPPLKRRRVKACQ